jgi:hypothetical protein
MSEIEENKMDTINGQLDNILVEFFETLGKLYKEQANLENMMKNGFLMMSRARYNMGTKSVGISQYDERNMKASKMVSMTTDDVNGRKTFEFVNPSDCTFDSSDESNELKGSSGLRQRKNVGSERVETLGPEGDQLISNDSNSKNCKIDNDPIKWFGVLVPQSLRQSQGYFKQATETVLNVSNLKMKVLDLKDKYKSLQKEKHMLSD